MYLETRFEIGDEVRVVRTIRNDGSVTDDSSKGNVLVKAGETGYVRSLGFFLQNQIIFRVYFPSEDRETGVRNEELLKSDLPWQENVFYRKQRVPLNYSLAHKGQVFARKNETVEIRDIKRNLDTGLLQYLVLAKGQWVWLEQGALQRPEPLPEQQPEQQIDQLNAFDSEQSELCVMNG